LANFQPECFKNGSACKIRGRISEKTRTPKKGGRTFRRFHCPGLRHVFADERGEIMEFVFIFPITLFLIFFAITWGMAVYTKSATVTASREAARAYAVYHDEELAKQVAADMMASTLGAEDVDQESVERWKEKMVHLEEIEYNGETYCKAQVNFRLPLPAWTGYYKFKNGIGVGASAIFKKEYIPDGMSGG